MNRYGADGVGKSTGVGWESCGALLGLGVAMQEQNAKIALGILSARAAAVHALLKQYTAQQRALMSLVDTGRGPVTERGVTDADRPDLPIGDYDRLDAGELEHRLRGLSVVDVEKLKTHERHTRNRRPMMECMDRALV